MTNIFEIMFGERLYLFCEQFSHYYLNNCPCAGTLHTSIHWDKESETNHITTNKYPHRKVLRKHRSVRKKADLAALQ